MLLNDLLRRGSRAAAFSFEDRYYVSDAQNRKISV